ncbi:MAG TPA: calcineurin-like phosphoesterase family protein [Lysobacter sp.]
MLRSLCCAAVLCLLAASHADAQEQAAQLTGSVYNDSNGNQRRDGSERGIAGIKVSNGRELAITDAQGRYFLPMREASTVFVIKPPGYATATGADGLPRFWHHVFPAGSPKLRYGGIAATTAGELDFPLRKQSNVGGDLKMLVFGDPQPKSLTDVGYYQRDIVAPLIGKHDVRLGLSLGDIVHDDLSLYPAMNQATSQLGVPWLHVPGNHDLDFDATRDEDALLSFRNVFGPDSYAWEEPQASFIVLDDVVVLPGQQPAYIGGLREDQFAFLQAYLATLPKDRRVVISVHIPFFEPYPGVESFRHVDRDRLFAMLKDHSQVLLLSAHTHNQRHYRHDATTGWHGAQPLHEYNAGAACGAFWSGVKDAQGIPDTTMSDGTPNGYAWLTFKPDGAYSLRYQAARAPADDAMALYAPRVLRLGAWAASGIYANVFMGDADSRVEYRIDDGAWKPMRRVAQPDPNLLAENLADDKAGQLRGYDRSPEAVPSTHLWRGVLPTDVGLGEHRIQVRVFDRWRGELTSETRYRLDQAKE